VDEELFLKKDFHYDCW